MLQNQAHSICVLTNWMCQNWSCPCCRLLAPFSHCTITSYFPEKLCVTDGLLKVGVARCQTDLSLH